MLDHQKLQTRREKLKLSQSDAAKAAGLSRQRWNDMESGRRVNITLAALDALALVLKCRAKDLIE